MNSSLFIAQKKSYTYFELFKNEDWNKIRLIWIAFYKNNSNNQCYFDQLPKDVILVIIKLLKISFFDQHRQFKFVLRE